MGYSSEINGLELFTAPFCNPQAYMAAPASGPQHPKTASFKPKAAVSPAQQPKAARIHRGERPPASVPLAAET